jgi:2-keto-4-pentenoate hydratase/2-oxohepta-3-ene-1,7-dioic acid hydratase in catechol pathway
MKLVRFKSGCFPQLGVVDGDEVVPVRSFSSMLDLIAAGTDGLDRVRKETSLSNEKIPLTDVRLLAPIEKPGKYLAIGLNYGKHAEEADKLGGPRTHYQVWFNKQTTCLSGPFDVIEPGATEKLDYEVELGVVVGKRAKNVSKEDAPQYIFGYFVANDVSARDYQFHTQTVTMGKSFDTHGPIGPWIVTTDEIPDPHKLDLRCFVNGELRQSSNTSQMIANIWSQIAYLTSAFTLEPGDLIATGTPEGVGVLMDPQVFLNAGDVVRCEIEGIGAIENRVAC